MLLPHSADAVADFYRSFGLPNGMRIEASVGADGVTVIHIDTDGATPLVHCARGEPYLRVRVNDDPVHRCEPADPLPGSARWRSGR